MTMVIMMMMLIMMIMVVMMDDSTLLILYSRVNTLVIYSKSLSKNMMEIGNILLQLSEFSFINETKT